MNSESSVRQSWLQLTSFQVGGALCLPILMIGQELGKNYGLSKAIIAIIVGNILLFGLSIIKATMVYHNKLSTIENATTYFGKQGSIMLASIMNISLLGWFAIQLNLISLSIQTSLNLAFGYQPPLVILNILLGIIMTGVALRGIRALNKLADIGMPLLLGTIIYVVYASLKNPSIIPTTVINNSYAGISLVLAASIMAVIDLPTYFRFSRSKRDSWLSIFLIFVIAIPLMEIAGVIIGMNNGDSILTNILNINNNVLYQTWILLFLILAGWTTNNANVYSAAVSLETVLPQFNHAVRTIIIGGIGTILSCFTLINNLETILNPLGILISSMGAVIATQYVVTNISKKMTGTDFINGISFILGTVYGFTCFFGITPSITGFEILDAFMVTCCATLLLTILNMQSLTIRNELL